MELVAAGQASQLPLPLLAAKVPAVHGKHSAAPGAENVPAGHARQVLLDVALSAALRVPAGQGVHASALAAPGVAPQRPAGQAAQAARLGAPSVALQKPAGQPWQVLGAKAPRAADHVPAAQGLQLACEAAADALLQVPAGQFWQGGGCASCAFCPGVANQVPGLQGKHSSALVMPGLPVSGLPTKVEPLQGGKPLGPHTGA